MDAVRAKLRQAILYIERNPKLVGSRAPLSLRNRSAVKCCSPPIVPATASNPDGCILEYAIKGRIILDHNHCDGAGPALTGPLTSPRPKKWKRSRKKLPARRGEEGFSSCLACPCHRAVAFTPPRSRCRIGQISASHAAFALRLQARLPDSFGFEAPSRSLSLRGDS